MRKLVDLYIVYELVRRITTPFKDTPAFKRGIIDAHGNVLRPMKTLTTKEDRSAWTWLDIFINNVKRALAVIPGAQSRYFTYAAALFLLREPVVKVREAAALEGAALCECVNHKYHSEARGIAEDAPAALVPANNVGSGNIAGVGVGPAGEPGFTPQRKRRKVKKPTAR